MSDDAAPITVKSAYKLPSLPSAPSTSYIPGHNMMSFVGMYDDSGTRLGPTVIVHAQGSYTSNQLIFSTSLNKMMFG